MDKYLEDLKSAFESVAIRVFESTALNSAGGTYVQRPENNFTSVIKRHFENIMETEENHPYYRDLGLVCDMDIRKDRVGIQPDIFVHRGANDNTLQIFYGEVKTDNVPLKDDLKKLADAILPPLKLNYRFGIMIVANKPLKSTKRAIQKFIRTAGLSNAQLEQLYMFHAFKITATEVKYEYKNFLEVKNRR